jgi:hypothetical protein
MPMDSGYAADAADDPAAALVSLLDPEGDLAGDDDGITLAPEPTLRQMRCQKEPWRCPKKPTLQRVKEDAQRAKEDHAYRVRINAAFNQWLQGERYGYFPGDAEFYANGALIPAVIDDLKNEHYNAVMWHARMDTQIAVQGREAIGVEEREAKADFARLLEEEWCAEYADAFGSSLKVAMPDCAGRTGMLVAFLAVDPGNATTGLRMQMFDPNACYPVWHGARGLAKVYIVYQATADDVIGDFGDNGGTVERKVRKLAREDSQDGTYNHLCEKELILYYDRDHTFVIWGGDLMRYYQHGYGRVPFVIETSGAGMQGFMATPDPVDTGTAADILAIGSEFWQINNRQMDMARRNQPPLIRLAASHAQKEALFSRLLSTLKTNTSPKGRPVVVGQEPMSVQDGEPEMKPGEAEVSLTRKDDTVVPYPNIPEVELTTPLLQMTTLNAQTGYSAITTQGASLGGAQAGGNAIDMLSTQGAERWSLYTLMVQGFWSKLIRGAFELVAEYGDDMGTQEHGLLVPRSHPGPGLFGLTDPHELTPDIFRRTGTRVTVTLHKFNPMSLPPLIQAIMMGTQSGLMSKETSITLIGAVQDVDDEIRRIKEDQLAAVPELMAAEQLEMGHKRAMRALMDGDPESARREILKTKYLADQLTVAMMARLSMVSQSTMEAMQSTSMADQMGASQFGQAAMGGGMNPSPALGAGQQPPQPNAAPFMSPSQFGGTTGQSSPGAGGGGQMQAPTAPTANGS